MLMFRENAVWNEALHGPERFRTYQLQTQIDRDGIV
jgi:hypothetical protein